MSSKSIFMKGVLCVGLCVVSHVVALRQDAQDLCNDFHAQVLDPVRDCIRQEQRRLLDLCVDQVSATTDMVELETLMISFGIADTLEALVDIRSFSLMADDVEVNGLGGMISALENRAGEVVHALRGVPMSINSMRVVQQRFVTALNAARNRAMVCVALASDRIAESIRSHMHELRDEMRRPSGMHIEEFEDRVAVHMRAIIDVMTAQSDIANREFGSIRTRLLRALRQ